jgi:hypothetical protein
MGDALARSASIPVPHRVKWWAMATCLEALRNLCTIQMNKT